MGQWRFACPEIGDEGEGVLILTTLYAALIHTPKGSLFKTYILVSTVTSD